MENTKKYIIFANPYSGKKNAVNIANKMLDIIKKPDIITELYISTKKNEFRDLISKRDITNLDAVIGIGGDGTISEIINGLLLNEDYNQNIKVGHIPSGSGNGLIKSILWEKYLDYNLENSISIIQQDEEEKLDIFNVTHGDNKSSCFLAISWGFVSDLDIGTERCRCLGNFRFTLGALYNLIFMQSYYGTLYYLPEDSNINNLIDNFDQLINMDVCWEKIESNFLFFWACNTSHASSETFSSPLSKKDDGFIHIIYILEGISRYEMVKILLNLDNGTYIHNPNVKIIKTTHFKLVAKNGTICMDGELMNEKTIECKYTKKINIF